MRTLVLTGLLLFLFSNVNGQYRKFDYHIWTIGTAKTVNKKELDLNLFYFSQYGIAKRIEIQAKPMWFYKLPNFGLKFTWWNKKSSYSKNFFKKLGIIVGSRHGIYYPTPTLNYIANKNLFNSNFTNTPAIFLLKNELLTSFVINKNTGCYKKMSLLTLKIGNQTALGSSGNYSITDNSLHYRLTSTFSDHSLWYIGIDYDSKFSYGLNYKIDIDFYSLDLSLKNLILEHKTIAYWYMGENHRIRPAIGYIISMSNIPGIRSNIFPIFDIAILFKIRKKSKNDQLFDNGVLPETQENRDDF